MWRSEKDVLTRVLRQIRVEVFPADSAFQRCAAALEVSACSEQKGPCTPTGVCHSLNLEESQKRREWGWYCLICLTKCKLGKILH